MDTISMRSCPLFLCAEHRMQVKPFAQLTRAAQVRRLRSVAIAALQQYGVAHAQLHVLSTTQGLVYRVDTADGNHFVLRISPADAPSPAMQDAQLCWLRSVASETSLCVPEPVPLPNGALWTTIAVHSVDEPRQCVLLRWVAGRARHDARRRRRPEPGLGLLGSGPPRSGAWARWGGLCEFPRSNRHRPSKPWGAARGSLHRPELRDGFREAPAHGPYPSGGGHLSSLG